MAARVVAPDTEKAIEQVVLFSLEVTRALIDTSALPLEVVVAVNEGPTVAKSPKLVELRFCAVATDASLAVVAVPAGPCAPVAPVTP
jgi:hypothetical protein